MHIYRVLACSIESLDEQRSILCFSLVISSIGDGELFDAIGGSVYSVGLALICICSGIIAAILGCTRGALLFCFTNALFGFCNALLGDLVLFTLNKDGTLDPSQGIFLHTPTYLIFLEPRLLLFESINSLRNILSRKRNRDVEL
jgi:hypothetical protein